MNDQRNEALAHLKHGADHLNAAILYFQNNPDKSPDRSDYSFLLNKLGEMFRETNSALHYAHPLIFQILSNTPE
jgi:hypothetical protein